MKKPTKKTAAKTVVDIKTKTERSPDWKRAARSLKAKPGDERRSALARLGVSEEQVAQAPEITPILKLVDGGIPKIVAAMRLAQDDVIRRFLQKWDSLSDHDRRRLSVEAVAIAAGVDINGLLGSITLAMQAVNVNMVKLLCVSNHVKVVQARLRFAQLPGGERDRTALDTALGFLPAARPATFIGKAIFGSGKNVMDQQRGPDDQENDEIPIAAGEIDLDRIFPAPNLTQEKLIPIRNRLPDPKTRIN